jgi:rhodanese-related sulfurtransferase
MKLCDAASMREWKKRKDSANGRIFLLSKGLCFFHFAPATGAILNQQTHNQNTNIMKKILTLLATAVLAVTAYAGEFPDISIAEVKAAVESKKATIIDVNGSDSYKSGHVPGAVDFQSVKAEFAKALPADKGALVIAYCGGPQCGAYAAAAKAAKELGYTNVKHMSAGISGWKDAGAPLEKQ